MEYAGNCELDGTAWIMLYPMLMYEIGLGGTKDSRSVRYDQRISRSTSHYFMIFSKPSSPYAIRSHAFCAPHVAYSFGHNRRGSFGESAEGCAGPNLKNTYLRRGDSSSATSPAFATPAAAKCTHGGHFGTRGTSRGAVRMMFDVHRMTTCIFDIIRLA